MTKLKPVVVSYLRFSRPEQAKGDSIRRQLAQSDAWVKERGLLIDTSLSDKGVSAFRGANATTGALGTFFELVKSGRIPRGSILLVESLDRLSRTEIRVALSQFLNLIGAGITVVTLCDGKEFSETQCELPDLMYSLMVMSRAHEESATKSQRLSEAWKGKRAVIGQKPLTKMLPGWCRLEGKKIVIDDQKAEAIRTLYRWILDGLGLTAVCKKANAELPPIGRVGYYFRSYVYKLVTNRSVLGEFQPHRITYVEGKKRREPTGEPVPGYFPAIVDAETFASVQAVLAKGRRSGGPNNKFINIFRGILHSPDGSRYHAIDKGAAQHGHVLISAATVDGRQGAGKQIAFPLTIFEAAFFSRLSEMALLKRDDADTDLLRRKLLAVEGELDIVAGKIRSLTEALLAAETASASVVAVLTKLDEKKAKLDATREGLQAELRTAELGSPGDAAGQINQLLVDSLLSSMPAEKRIKLRSLVGQIVQRIDAKVTREGIITTCKVQVKLVTGTQSAYTVTFHGRHRNTFVVEWKGGYQAMAIEGDATAEKWHAPADIVKMRQEGKKLSEIMLETGLGLSAIYRAIHRAGTTPQKIRPKVRSLRWASKPKKN